MKLSKRLTLITLAALFLVGSLVTAFACNLFFSDVLNMQSFPSNSTMIVSFPALMLGAILVTCFLYIYRLYKRPNTFKRMSKLYLIINICLSGIGALTALLSGVLVYKTFVGFYPFSGYVLIFFILHLLLVAGNVCGLLMLKKFPEDEEVYKSDWKHVLSTIGWYLFICLVMNRFGMLLISPMYIQWSTFDVTFVFYLFLLMAAVIGCYKICRDFFGGSKKIEIICSSVLIGVTVALFVVIVVIGMKYPVFVSAVSPAMPLERLASKPLELPIHFVSYLAVLIILLVQAIKQKEE